jgi:hypothetical protein
MILFQIDPPSVTISPLEGNAPRSVDMKRVARRLATQGVEVEARDVQGGDVLRTMQRAEPDAAAPHEVGPNPARVILQEQASQPLVTKALDHKRGYAVRSLL